MSNYKGKYTRMFPKKLSTNSLISTYILHILKEKDEALYGQEIAAVIRERTELRDASGRLVLEGYELSRGVLYGSLRLLEEKKLIDGHWEKEDISNKRTRYFYKITDLGREVLEEMIKENEKSLNEAINAMSKIRNDLAKNVM